MSRELILHAGMNKTGSTAIQGALHEAGSGADWEAVRLIHPNASNVIRQAFGGRQVPNPDLPAPSFAASAEAAQRCIEDGFAAITKPRAVISAEDLRKMTGAEFASLIAVCRGHFDDVQAVAYIRAPYGFVASSFQQRLHAGFVPLADAVRPAALDYAKQFASVEVTLGADFVRYRPYLRERFPGGSVVADFAEWLSLGPLRPQARSANTGLSAQAVRLAYLWRRAHPARRLGDGVILHRLAEVDGPPFQIAQATLGASMPCLAAQRDWAMARMEWDMAEPEADGPHGIRTEADFEEIAPATLEWLAQAARCKTPRSPDEVAHAVEALRITKLDLPRLARRAVRRLARK